MGTFLLRLAAVLLITAACTVTGCSAAEPEIQSLTFTPDSKSIVFAHPHHGSSELFIASLADGRATRLTHTNCGQEYEAVFSHAGDIMAFSCSGHIFIARSDGSGAHQLTKVQGNEAKPRFSPDGKRIYFAKWGYFGSYSPIAQPHAHEWDVFASDLEGSNLEQLTNQNFYTIAEMSVAPDGSAIIVSTGADEKVFLYPIQDGTLGPPKSIRPVSADGQIASDAQYSPDGTSILFTAPSNRVGAYNYDVYRMNLQTTARQRLTTHNGYATDLRVSPDGKSAVFLKWSLTPIRRIPEHPVPYILNLETKEIRRLSISFSE